MTNDHDRPDPIVSVRGLRTHYVDRQWWFQRLRGRQPGAVRAVDGVDLDIRRGEVVCLVGESGSGKTTLGRAILRLAPATHGQIFFQGRDITGLRGAEFRRLRPKMQMIFQDPHGSLSPRLRVSELLSEPYRIHDVPAEQRYSVAELLEMVELSAALAQKYPHELSGGQARRIGIARALSLHPDFLVADEPTAGLDVSAAAKILSLLRSLRASHGLTYLVITHNLRIVDYLADRLAVMYLGRVAEIGPAEQVLDAPAHPYTRALLDSVSEPDPHRRQGRRRLLLPGEIPSPKNPPSGCSFHPRCRFAEAVCREVPPLAEVDAGHLASCHLSPKIRAAGTPV
ncbi:ATP-binding cassette domain-containing protein [Micromonospora sp. WMMC415]|nr:ATP-binding cassette domain-containing protein [Micromonospora sp. WMMC415]